MDVVGRSTSWPRGMGSQDALLDGLVLQSSNPCWVLLPAGTKREGWRDGGQTLALGMVCPGLAPQTPLHAHGRIWDTVCFAWKNVVLTPVASRDQPEPQTPSSAVFNAE